MIWRNKWKRKDSIFYLRNNNDIMSREQNIKIGDKVTFDTDKVEEFKAATSSQDKAVQDYRKLVLAGVDQVGIVKELGFAMATLTYPDGWELPVPLKYLVILQ